MMLPVAERGYYTIVVSRPVDRPKNATVENGVAWWPFEINAVESHENLPEEGGRRWWSLLPALIGAIVGGVITLLGQMLLARLGK